MIANLMMYQRPQLAAAHDRYWQLILRNLNEVGIDGSEHLSQNAEEFFVWKNPNLVLSQTCGMPYRIWLHDLVELVGTPDYGLDGCPPGYYRSALVVRSDDARQDIVEFSESIFAFNQTFSQSGYAAPYWHLRKHGFWFQNRLHTEQHVKSAQAVASGRADIASLDAMSWKLMEKHDAFAQELRVLDWTAPTPGLPLITANGNDADSIFSAVKSAIKLLDPLDRGLLGLCGIVRIPKDKYTEIPNPP